MMGYTMSAKIFISTALNPSLPLYYLFRPPGHHFIFVKKLPKRHLEVGLNIIRCEGVMNYKIFYDLTDKFNFVVKSKTRQCVRVYKSTKLVICKSHTLN